MNQQERIDKVVAAIDELDLRRQSHRTAAQVGVVLVQMFRLGFAPVWQPDPDKIIRGNYSTRRGRRG